MADPGRTCQQLWPTATASQDLKHDRTVAIKVLRPELAAVIGAVGHCSGLGAEAAATNDGGDMAKHIARYQAAWHPEMHRGVIFLEYADGGKGRLDPTDGAEFAALLGVLRHRSAVISSEGWIETDLEEPA